MTETTKQEFRSRQSSPSQMVNYSDASVDERKQWGRTIDLLSPLNWQSQIISSRRLYYFRGSVSEKLGSHTAGEQYVELPSNGLNGLARQETTTTQNTTVMFGSKRPFNQEYREDEFFEVSDAASSVMESFQVPDISSEEMGVLFAAPEWLREEPGFEDVERVAHHRVTSGNRSTSFERKIGLPMVSRFDVAKKKLKQQGLLESSTVESEFGKRAKGCLVTEAILTDQGHTQRDLAREGLLQRLLEDHCRKGHLLEDWVDPVTIDVNHPQYTKRDVGVFYSPNRLAGYSENNLMVI